MKQPTFTHSLVLAIDGSDHAAAAVELILNLPLPKECQITILTVLIPRMASQYASLKKILSDTQKYLQAKDKQVKTELLTGYPAEQILQYTSKHETDLIVLGAKGLRGTFRILLGGVAQQIVEYAHCPVLLVRTPHTQAKRVLLVTDGSEHSKYAVQFLGQCPLPSNSKIDIIHILPPEMTTDMLYRSWPYGIDVIPPVISSDLDENLMAQASKEEEIGKAILEDTIASLSEINLKAKPILRRGDAATEILNYAQEEKVDLIVVGSRGLGQMQNLLLGSVSSKLIHYAECSILVVKQP